MNAASQSPRWAHLCCAVALLVTAVAFVPPGSVVASAATPTFDRQWGVADGVISGGSSVTVDATGNVYVLSSRVDKFNASGAFVTKWGTFGTGDGQFDYPRVIEVGPSGNIYVLDTNNQRVQIFSPTGVFLSKWDLVPADDGLFLSAGDMTIDASGNVYVTDRDHNNIQRFSSAGAFLGKWGVAGTAAGQLFNPTGITVSPAGVIYVFDEGPHTPEGLSGRVQRFTPTGTFLGGWTNPWISDGYDLAVNAAGDVFITEGYGVSRYDSTGVYVGSMGCSDAWECSVNRPRAVELGPDGNVYVLGYDEYPPGWTDLSGELVKEFLPVGTYVSRFGLPRTTGGNLSGPQGLAVRGSNVYVVDTDHHTLQQFNVDGGFIRQWGGYGAADGQFKYPRGVATDSAGNVYVTDGWNDRVQKFSPTGVFLTKWGSEGAGPGQFNQAVGIAIDSHDNVYVADRTLGNIQKFSSTGVLLGTVGTHGTDGNHLGNGYIYGPMGLAIDAADNLYVANTYNYRIEKFNAAGTFVTKWAHPSGYWPGPGGDRPVGITVSDTGDVWVTDTINHVNRFTTSGGFIDQFGGYGSEPSAFRFDVYASSEGIAGMAAVGGKLWVSDYWNNRVQQFSVPTVTLPTAPLAVTATAWYRAATISWSAPAADGGAAVIGYTVTSSPGSLTCSTSWALSCQITTLTNGTTYTFTVTATTGVGLSPASQPSAPVTPTESSPPPPLPPPDSPPGPTPDPTVSGFHAITPARVFDTRPDAADGLVPVTKQRYGGSDEVRVQVTGAGQIPFSGVGAVSLNVTVVDPVGAGYVTVYPCGQRPLASNLNYTAGQTVPNAVIAPVSASGEVCFYSMVATHLIADVNGWFANGASFTPLSPVRVFDTRASEAQGAVTVVKQRYGGGNVLTVKVTDVAGVPAAGVGAVSLNVTAVSPVGAGYVTVFPCGERPLASNLNYTAGQTVPNAVIAPVSASGEVCFYSMVDTHLIADVNGWFAAGVGFHALVPARVFDTRPDTADGLVPVIKQRYGGTNGVRIKVTGAGQIPESGVGAVSLNVTAVDPIGSGFVTVYPCGERPLASNLNYTSGQTVPNAVIAPVSTDGEVCIYSMVDTHLIADVNGWFGG